MKFPSYEYFDNVYKNQRQHIQDIVSRLKLKGKKVISIGSGTGAEEILFAEEGVRLMDCIEQDINGCLITLSRVSKDYKDIVHAFHTKHEDFILPYKYDLIYTSSPSDWMHEHTWHEGIPTEYCDFIERFSTKNGFFIAVIYGGTFHGQTIPGYNLDSSNIHEFIAIISDQCNSMNWHLLECWEGWANGPAYLIVLSKKFIKLSDDVTFENCFKRWSQKHKCERVYVK